MRCFTPSENAPRRVRFKAANSLIHCHSMHTRTGTHAQTHTHTLGTYFESPSAPSSPGPPVQGLLSAVLRAGPPHPGGSGASPRPPAQPERLEELQRSKCQKKYCLCVMPSRSRKRRSAANKSMTWSWESSLVARKVTTVCLFF